jgi:hypothetical protein
MRLTTEKSANEFRVVNIYGNCLETFATQAEADKAIAEHHAEERRVQRTGKVFSILFGLLLLAAALGALWGFIALVKFFWSHS